MSADYGERSIEWAIQAYHARTETPVSPEPCDTSNLDAHKPSREEVDAALLLTWSDERWQAWADQHVADLVKVRQMFVDKGFGFEPYTESEIADMRASFVMPQTDDEKLDWLRHRVADHAERREVHRPLDRHQSTSIPESPDDRLARLKARGVQVDDSQSHLVRCTLRELITFQAQEAT